ncbi:MAG: GAF domain-containing protein [Chloroflexota bacterium]
MLVTPSPENELKRLLAIQNLKILDTPPEQRFDRITRLATQLFDAPIALLTLIDAERQWFKSCQGVPMTETPRAISFCQHTIEQDEVFVIPDMHLDARFANNPVVTGEPHVVFYAGYPVATLDGTKVGSLCILDYQPRTFSKEQQESLKDLAIMAQKELQGWEIESLHETASELTTYIRQQRHINRFMTAISKVLRKETVQSLPQMLHGCVQAMVDHLDAAFARIWTLNEPLQLLELQASAGMYTHLDGAHSRIPVGQFKIGMIAKEQQPHLTNDVQRDARVGDKAWAKREGMVAFAGYPLIVGDRVFGVMALFARRTLDTFVLEAMESVANNIAVSIDLKHVEDRLRKTSAVAESSPAVLFRWRSGMDWPVEYVSDNIRRFGYTPEELLSGNVRYADMIHPDDFKRTAHEIMKYSASGVTEFTQEYRLLTKDGQVRWTDDRTVIERNAEGKITHYQGIVLDITERKEAEAALAKQYQQTQELLDETERLYDISLQINRSEGLQELMAVVGQNLTIPVINRVILSLIDYDDNGKMVAIYHAANWYSGQGPKPSPVGRRFERETFKTLRFLLTKEPLFVEDTQTDDLLGRPLGEYFLQMGIAAIMVVPLWSGSHQLGILLLESDVPHLCDEYEKRSILAVSQHVAAAVENHLLFDQVQQRAAELAKAKDVAEVASQAKSTFLSQMTHELRTPMNGVLGMATLMSDTSLNEKQRDILDTLRASGDTLLTIINDILDFSKIEANQMELEKVPFTVKTCIEQAFDLVRPHALAKGLSLDYTIDKSVPAGLIQDVTRVRQILTNLVVNAVKFTDEGRITVRVKASSIDNKSNASSPDDLKIQFSIKDTGIGIPKDRINRLFQSFSQVDASTTRKYGGTGLGLAISKQLCELMGGDIWVDSTPNVGSTFHFTIIAQQVELPKAKPAKRASANKKLFDKNMAKEKPLRILLTEDNVINQKVALGVLKKCGYTADVAANGLEAINALMRQPYDVILMDVHMPEMDGVTATKRIRAQWPPEEQPTIIALTADAMDQQREAYLGAGMDDLVTKPIRIPALVSALQRVPFSSITQLK